MKNKEKKTTATRSAAGPTATRPTAVRLTAAITTRRTTAVSSRTQKQQSRFGMQKALMKA
jgi:methylthioribose-1-phosphate isomerase